MPLKDVANSFPDDVNVLPPPPPLGLAPLLAPIGVGHGVGHAALMPPPQRASIQQLWVERPAESAQIQPGGGLQPIDLAPRNAATDAAPAAKVFGDHSTHFKAGAVPAANYVEPFLISPGDTSPTRIRLEVDHAANSGGIHLDLHRCPQGEEDAPVLVWSNSFHDVTALAQDAPLAPAPGRSYFVIPFDGKVSADNGATTLVTEEEFPGFWLDGARGPYRLTARLMMTVPPEEAWTYFNVPSHAFKLLRYAPTTGLGRFGLEFVPGETDLKVIFNTWIGYQRVPALPLGWPADVPHHPPLIDNNAYGFDYTGFNDANLRAETDTWIRERIFKDWSAHYAVRLGGNDLRPLVLVNTLGSAEINHEDHQANYDAYLNTTARAAAPDYDLALTIRKGIGGSGVVPAAEGMWLRLYYPPALWEREGNPGNATAAAQKDVALIRNRMKQELDGAPTSVTSDTAADACTIKIRFGADSHALDPSTEAWLNDLADALANAKAEIASPIEVLLQGHWRNGSSRGSKKALAAVKRVLAAKLPQGEVKGATTYRCPCRNDANGTYLHRGNVILGGGPDAGEASESAASTAGYVFGPETYVQEPLPRYVVYLSVRTPDSPHAYNATVHEFGHMFGLPDEYMDYTYPGSGCLSVQYSQERLTALSGVFGASAPSFPSQAARVFDSNLMTLGTVFHDRYYLPFVEALAKLTSIGHPNALTFSPDRPARDALDITEHNNPVENPLFADVAAALRAAVHHFEHSHAGLAPPNPPLQTAAQLRAEVLNRINASPLDANKVLYVLVRDADAVDPALATNRPGQNLIVHAGVLVDGACLHACISTDLVRADIDLEIDDNVVQDTLLLPAAGSGRIKLTLRAGRTFQGTGRVQVSANGVIDLFDAQNGGNPVNAATAHTAANLATGVDIWAEGVGVGTVQVTLELVDNAAVFATSTPCDVHVVPPAELGVVGGDGFAAVSQHGLFVPLQGQVGATFAASPFLLRKHREDLGHLIELRVTTNGAGRVSLHHNGGAALGLPASVADNHYEGSLASTYALKGTTESSALGDTVLEAVLNGVVVSSAPVTVVGLHDVQVTIPATPRLTARNFGLDVFVHAGVGQRTTPHANVGPHDPPEHVIKPHLSYYETPPVNVAPLRKADYGQDGFDANQPLVLIEGSCNGTVQVEAKVTNFAYPSLQWVVERSEDDDERLARLITGRDRPTLTDGAGAVAAPHFAKPATLALDHVGSFHLRLQAEQQTLATVNVVLVRAWSDSDDDESRANVPKRVDSTAIDAGGGHRPVDEECVIAQAGTFAGAAIGQNTEEKFGCVLRGSVKFIGGGPGGRRGKEEVFPGWIQNLTSYVLMAKYEDSAHPGAFGTLGLELVGNSGAGDYHDHDPYFTNAGVTPFTALGGGTVILDTGRPQPGQGGVTACLGQFDLKPAVDTDDLGWSRETAVADAPGTQFYLRHRAQPEALLTECWYDHVFKACLCVWTESNRPAFPGFRDGGVQSNVGGERLYGVVGEVEWRLRGSWDVTIRDGGWKGAGNGAVSIPNNKVKLKAQKGSKFTVSISKPFVGKDGAEPAEGKIEVAQPTMLQCFGWNAYW